VHSVNFVAKLVHTRRALSSTVINSHQDPVSGQACNPLDPHWFSFPFHGGGALRYSVPKWLLFLHLCVSGFHSLRSFSFLNTLDITRKANQGFSNCLTQEITIHIIACTCHRRKSSDARVSIRASQSTDNRMCSAFITTTGYASRNRGKYPIVNRPNYPELNICLCQTWAWQQDTELTEV
jgi:hypothetical protein